MEKRAVVVTGASSGIGRATALRLSKHGTLVFAGVRRPEDADALLAEDDTLVPLIMDVTDPDSLAEAAREVAAELDGTPLSGLVNNAGLAQGAPLEFHDLDDVRQLLDVNVVGLLAATQAFLPQLRGEPGRIVCVGSMSGRFTMPFLGAYAASKAAVASLCDALRVELRPWHIHVTLVEPGNVATPIWDKGFAAYDARASAWPPQAQELYGEVSAGARALTEQTVAKAISPERVAKVIEHALTAGHPRTRYLVGADAHALSAASHVPDKQRDALLSSLLKLASRN